MKRDKNGVDKKAALQAAIALTNGVPWNTVAFPDLSKAESNAAKWNAVYETLVLLSMDEDDAKD